MITKISQTAYRKNNYASKKQVNFGYNQEVNKQLITLLDKGPGDYFGRVKGLVEFCNSTEDLIAQRTMEKNSSFETDPLIAMLFDIKPTLCDLVDELFPNLHFAQKEIKSYSKEGKKALFDWKQELAEELGDVENDAVPVTEGKVQDKFHEFEPNSESPKGFSSLGGMDELKQSLYDKIIFPILEPEKAKLDEVEYGKKFPRATLLYGPPGCGKTFIAEAVAREAGVPFYKLKISKLGSHYQNLTASNYQGLFDAIAEKSKKTGKPCILFIDELEGVTKNRNAFDNSDETKQVDVLLDLINEARSRGIIVIGATNKYDLVDEAIKSRFDNQEFVGLPDKITRKEVLKKSLANRSKAVDLLNLEEDLTLIAERFDGFSNRSICDLSEKAAAVARKDGRRQITKEDYINIIAKSQNLKVKNGNDDYKPEVARKVGFATDDQGG